MIRQSRRWCSWKDNTYFLKMRENKNDVYSVVCACLSNQQQVNRHHTRTHVTWGQRGRPPPAFSQRRKLGTKYRMKRGQASTYLKFLEPYSPAHQAKFLKNVHSHSHCSFAVRNSTWALFTMQAFLVFAKERLKGTIKIFLMVS